MSDKYKGRIAIPTSGDAEKDQRDIEAFELHQERMDKNICPNGCAEMIFDDPHNRHCPVCNFHGWQNTPILSSMEPKGKQS